MGNGYASALKILGSGSSSGGAFSKVRVMGEGRVSGDIDCIIAKTYGTSSFDKDVRSDEFTVYGNSQIRGRVTSRRIKIYGDADFYDSDADELIVWGNLDIFGSHTGHKVNTKGNLSIEGNCEVDNFLSKGKFSVAGLLSADLVDIGLKFGTSDVKEIGGEKIIVKQETGIFSRHKHPLLIAENIEGDDIFLENTKAKSVRGKKIRIGHGCEIDSIEYMESCTVSRGSYVHSQEKMG